MGQQFWVLRSVPCKRGFVFSRKIVLNEFNAIYECYVETQFLKIVSTIIPSKRRLVMNRDY